MFNKMFFTMAVISFFVNVATVKASEVPLTGTVASKCVVIAETQGVYGNPSPYRLTTEASGGGVKPRIRFDVIQPDYYKAHITYPESFVESPSLTDVLNWSGVVTVAEVTDPLMSDYENTKIVYNNVTEIPLTVAGSTWFEISSQVDYGFNKALPAGTYRAIIQANCIAQ